MIDKKLLDKYIALLNMEVQNGDTEGAHSNADDLLCQFLAELGYHEVVDVYEQIDKWYA